MYMVYANIDNRDQIIADLLAISVQAESDLSAKLKYIANGGGDEIQIAAIERKLTAARAAIAKATDAANGY